MKWFVKSKRAQSSTDNETWIRGGVCPTLNAFDTGDTRATALVLGFMHKAGMNIQAAVERTPTIKAGHDTMPSVFKDSRVRRLTPVECERLQGFEDDWTAGQADSHRYKQMGNAVTVNVAHYIAELINSAVKEQP